VGGEKSGVNGRLGSGDSQAVTPQA
jgi:hypothetical protein